MRTSAALFALLVLPACAGSQHHSEIARPITVTEVVDGDTIVVDHRGRLVTLRLLGVDTPESVDPTRPVQCYGVEASEWLRSVLPPGTAVDLERDEDARDKYDRFLAYVRRTDDGLFVNHELIERGFAAVSIYEPNDAYRGPFTAAETGARTRGAGLWGACGGPDVPLDPP